jgi:exodeoxyribonuclease VII large subunit
MDTPSYAVSELLLLVRRALDVCFPDEVWVEGELSGIRRNTRNGHVYFSLIEPGADGQPPTASLDVVLFQGARREVNRVLNEAGGAIRMDDGVRVRIGGRIELYGRTGRVQLRMRTIDPTFTLAQLTLARDDVIRRLRAEGLVGRNAAVPLHPLPLRLGVVTSLNSAAHADLLHELQASGLAWHLVQCDAAVQGVGAERALVDALHAVVATGVHAVAMVRGGGARTDLAAFDAEVLARAIAACPVPVFTGIGHEIDRCVADEVAALAAKTPTACAAALVAHARAGLDELDRRWGSASRGAHRVALVAEHRVHATQVAVAHRAERRLGREHERLASAGDRLALLSRHALRAAELGIDARAQRTAAHDPVRTLARGWSVTRTADGRVLRQRGDAAVGDTIVTQLATGVLTSTVTATHPPPTPSDPRTVDHG